jgi:hypothetical protein
MGLHSWSLHTIVCDGICVSFCKSLHSVWVSDSLVSITVRVIASVDSKYNSKSLTDLWNDWNFGEFRNKKGELLLIWFKSMLCKEELEWLKFGENLFKPSEMR